MSTKSQTSDTRTIIKSPFEALSSNVCQFISPFYNFSIYILDS